MLLLVSHALAGGLASCPRTFDPGEILGAAVSAESAFVKLDATGFAESHAALRSRLVCSKDILSRTEIARVHRVEALAAFLDERDTVVPLALAGLFTAEPGHQIPTTLLPEGHPIRALVSSSMLALRDDPGVAIPPMGSGWIEVDGGHSLIAPTQRGALLQQIDGQGRVLATHYRWPDETGFDWLAPVAPAADEPVAPDLTTPAKVRNGPSPWPRRGTLLGGTVASLAASGALFATALQANALFDDAPTLPADATDAQRDAYRERLESLRTTGNAYSYGAYAAAGVGVALGVVTVITW